MFWQRNGIPRWLDNSGRKCACRTLWRETGRDTWQTEIPPLLRETDYERTLNTSSWSASHYRRSQVPQFKSLSPGKIWYSLYCISFVSQNMITIINVSGETVAMQRRQHEYRRFRGEKLWLPVWALFPCCIKTLAKGFPKFQGVAPLRFFGTFSMFTRTLNLKDFWRDSYCCNLFRVKC